MRADTLLSCDLLSARPFTMCVCVYACVRKGVNGAHVCGARSTPTYTYTLRSHRLQFSSRGRSSLANEPSIHKIPSTVSSWLTPFLSSVPAHDPATAFSKTTPRAASVPAPSPSSLARREPHLQTRHSNRRSHRYATRSLVYSALRRCPLSLRFSVVS
jgi:hypothetical protein